jgi:hypothetical protein
MAGLRHLQTLIATEDRLYVAAEVSTLLAFETYRTFPSHLPNSSTLHSLSSSLPRCCRA